MVGSISVDLTVAASPLPRPGETVVGTRFSTVLGGKGANQAVAAARAGATTTMVGAVGRDPFAGLALDALRADQVDVGWVEEVDGATGVAHIRVDSPHRRERHRHRPRGERRRRPRRASRRP